MKKSEKQQENKLSSVINAILLLIITLAVQSYSNAQAPDWLIDATHEAGLDSAKGTKILCVDVNNDNYPDLFWGQGNLNKNRFWLYLNLPDPENPGKRKYVDFTVESNVNQNRDPNKTGRVADIAAFADVDNDGDLDLVTSIYYHRWQMYDSPEEDPGDRSEVLLNDGTGKFTLVNNNGLTDIVADPNMPAGIINATGFAFLDYDLDGFVDLYISTWFSDYAKNLENNGNGYKMPDVLLKGNGNGTFTKISNNGVQISPEPMYGVNATDWNNDGWQDIMTCAYCRSSGSLFKNNQDGTFTDYSTQSGYTGQFIGGDHGQALCNWEAQPGDFDNDGDMDLLQVQVHGGYDKGEGRTHVTINKGEQENYKLVWALDRIRRDAPPSRTHIGDQGGTWIDIDADMKLDIAIGQMGYSDAANNINMEGQSRLYICMQNDTGYFDDVTKKLGLFYSMQEAHSMEPCDYDLDGDQDLFVSHQVKDSIAKDTIIDGVTKTIYTYYNRMQVSLLRNDIGNKNNWISVKLDQPEGANQGGLGSRVRVFSNGVSQIRELQAGLGHCSGQQPFIVNFGLKGHNYIDSVLVTWPHKTEPHTVIYNPPLNSIVEIGKEGMKPSPVKNWQGTKPVIACSKPYVRFTNINAGTTGFSAIDIKNIGDADLNVSKVFLRDSSKDFFFMAKEFNDTILKPGEFATVEFGFTPDRRAWYYSLFEINSNAFNQKDKLVDIIATGFEEKPIIAYDKINISWDSVFAFTDTKKKMKVFNKGEQTLKVTNFEFIDNDKEAFYVVNPEKSFEILPGGYKEIGIGFKPLPEGKWTEPATYKATIAIESNAFNTDTNKVSFIGHTNGPAPMITLSPGSIFIGSVDIGSFVERIVTLSNPGNSTLTVYGIESKDDIDSVFRFSGIEFPTEIPAGEQKELTVTYKPVKAEKTNVAANILTNACLDSVQQLSMRGSGREPETVVDYSDDGSILIIPNPAMESTELVFNIDINISSAEILDLFGNKVKAFDYAGFATAGSRINLDLAAVACGSYYLVLKCGKINKLMQLIVIK